MISILGAAHILAGVLVTHWSIKGGQWVTIVAAIASSVASFVGLLLLGGVSGQIMNTVEFAMGSTEYTASLGTFPCGVQIFGLLSAVAAGISAAVDLKKKRYSSSARPFSTPDGALNDQLLTRAGNGGFANA